jgi:hypothetical protein
MILPGGLNGTDIYRRICVHKPDMKCLFMSGYASSPDLHLPEEAEILAKPVAVVDLAAKLRQVLDA